MNQTQYIGIDWGTTHRRASLLDSQGNVTSERRDSAGMLACAGRFRPALETLLQHWPEAHGVSTVIMSGMVGAAAGWQEVPYVDCSTPLADLPQYLAPVRDAVPGQRWVIVPGYRWCGPQGQIDVMRGEETQLLGALRLLGPHAADGCYVLPGTHSKWVEIRGGMIHSLRTYMSGELFALLRERGTLASAMQTAPADEPLDPVMFARGVENAGEAGLSNTLFGARARVVTGAIPPQAASAYVSGLLIGAEWRDLKKMSASGSGMSTNGCIRIIAETSLSEYHAACARQLGYGVELLDAQAIQHAAWQALSPF